MTKILGVFSCCLGLSACFDYRQELQVNYDGTFIYDIELAFKKSELDNLGATFETSSCNTTLAPVFDDPDVKLQFLHARKYDTGSSNRYLVCRYRLNGHIDEGFAWTLRSKGEVFVDDMFKDSMGLSVSLKRERDDTYRLQAEHIVVPPEPIDPKTIGDIANCEGVLGWVVKVPKIVETNGRIDSVNRVSWSVCNRDAYKGYPYTQKFYVTFTNNVGYWERLLRFIPTMVAQ